MTYAEAPQPQRGQTLDEQQEALRAQQPPEEEVGEFRGYLRALHPRQMLAMGDGMPVVIKQLVQLLFLLCWPIYAFAGLCVGVIYYWVLYPVLWVLFWPVRAWFKNKEPDATPADPAPRA